MANPAAIDSIHRQIQEKIDPLVYSEEDQNKVEKNRATQIGGREESEPNKLAQRGAAQNAKDSQSMDHKSNNNPDEDEYGADFTKIPRSPEQVTDGDFVIGDSKIGTPNSALAEDNKFRKARKPRFPRPLEFRKYLHRKRLEIVSTKRGEGQVRVSLVTPGDNPDMLISKHNRHEADANGDAGHDEVQGDEMSSVQR